MDIRCLLVAGILLVTQSGCILDLFFGGDKKQGEGIRPVGADKVTMAPVDGNFDKVKDPKINADTWFAAGQLHEAQGNLPAAIDQYKSALKQNDEHHGALYRLGVLYATTKNYPEAIALIKGAKNPDAGKKLIDWATSPAMQGLFAKHKINFVPAHPDVKTEASLAEVLKAAKIFAIDDVYAGANRKRIVERWVAEVLP